MRAAPNIPPRGHWLTEIGMLSCLTIHISEIVPPSVVWLRAAAYDGLEVALRAGLYLDKRLRFLHSPRLRDVGDGLCDGAVVLTLHCDDRIEGPKHHVHMRHRRYVANLEKTGPVGIAVDRNKDERSLLD